LWLTITAAGGGARPRSSTATVRSPAAANAATYGAANAGPSMTTASTPRARATRDRRGGVGRAAAVGGHRQRGEVPRREHRQGRRWIAADHQRRRAAGVDRGLGERGQPQRVAAAEPVAGVGAQQQPRRDHATCSSSQRVSSTPSRGSAWSLE
jgi:hypothetical protein